MWKDQQASRTMMYITSPLCYYDEGWRSDKETKEISRWVLDFFIEHGYGIDNIKDHIVPPEIKVTLISEERISEEEYNKACADRVDETGWTEEQKDIYNTYMAMLGLRITF